MKQTVVYLRPLKDQPDVAVQLQDIKRFTAEVRPSAKMFREKEPGGTAVLAEVLRSLRSVTECLFVIWRIDALAGCFDDLPALLRFLGKLLEQDHHIVSVQDGLDTRRELGSVLQALADAFEVQSTALKTERQRIAMHKMAAAGKAIGRPRQDIAPETVREMKNAGQTIKSIAQELKTSPATIQRVLHRDDDKNP